MTYIQIELEINNTEKGYWLHIIGEVVEDYISVYIRRYTSSSNKY